MIAHFANNACIIAIALAGSGHEDGAMSTKLRLALIALGSAGLTAGGALLARDHRMRARRAGSTTADDAATHRL